MKSLKIVQTIVKVFKILAEIAMICAFVAAGLGIVCGSVVLSTDNTAIWDMFVSFGVEEAGYTRTQLGVLLLAHSAEAIATAITAMFTFFYLKAEQRDGTPFTFDGAKGLLRLGIIYMVIAVVEAIVVSVLLSAFGLRSLEDNISAVVDGNFATGIVFILLSFVFRYGAELEQDKNLSV